MPLNTRRKGRDFFWNMVGSTCYSLSSIVYLMLVTRFCGVMTGGIFALAFATAQLLLTFGRYGMRTYQATDTKRLYSFTEYGLTRIITCIGMVLLSLPYCWAMRYSFNRLLIFLFVAGLKMLDATEDVFHGELQRSEHVAEMGQLLAVRNVLSVVVFASIILLTRDLLYTCIVTDIASLLLCLTINFAAVRKLCPDDSRLCLVHLKELFVICFPIFISTFLSLFLYNIPKYAIDYYMTEDIQTYYSVLFMPSFIITLFSEIITRPMLTTIAVVWIEDLHEFCNIVARIFLLIVASTVCAVLGGHFLGRWLLEMIYGVDLSPYKLEFVILLIGGGLSAAVYISYNVLISIRVQRFIIMGYLGVAVAATPLTYLAVKGFAMMGASCSYLLTCLALEIVFGAVLIIQLHKRAAESG